MSLNIPPSSTEHLSASAATSNHLPSFNNHAFEREITLKLLSSYYLFIADGFARSTQIPIQELQRFREFSAEFEFLSRIQDSNYIPKLGISATAGQHVADIAIIAHTEPQVINAVWRFHGEVLARVISWLKGLAGFVLVNARSTSTPTYYSGDDQLFFLSCGNATTVEMFTLFYAKAESLTTYTSRQYTVSATDHAATTVTNSCVGDKDDEHDTSFDVPRGSIQSHLLRELVFPDVRFLDWDDNSMTYSGSSTHYSVERNVVLIHDSDARDWPSRRPPVGQGYAVLSLDDPKSISWRRSIGRLIGGAFLSQMKQTRLAQKSRVPWTLGAFPSDYVLTRHTSSSRKADGTEKKRTDMYLYGSTYRFASPAEFAAHAIWLMRGGSGHCMCKGCSGSPQSSISAVLEEAVERANTVDLPMTSSHRSQGHRGTKRKYDANGDVGGTDLEGPSGRQCKRRQGL